jgi:hypothetical protein
MMPRRVLLRLMAVEALLLGLSRAALAAKDVVFDSTGYRAVRQVQVPEFRRTDVSDGAADCTFLGLEPARPTCA